MIIVYNVHSHVSTALQHKYLRLRTPVYMCNTCRAFSVFTEPHNLISVTTTCKRCGNAGWVRAIEVDRENEDKIELGTSEEP